MSPGAPINRCEGTAGKSAACGAAAPADFCFLRHQRGGTNACSGVADRLWLLCNALCEPPRTACSRSWPTAGPTATAAERTAPGDDGGRPAGAVTCCIARGAASSLVPYSAWTDSVSSFHESRSFWIPSSSMAVNTSSSRSAPAAAPTTSSLPSRAIAALANPSFVGMRREGEQVGAWGAEAEMRTPRGRGAGLSRWRDATQNCSPQGRLSLAVSAHCHADDRTSRSG
jgi:hypothetical protein